MNSQHSTAGRRIGLAGATGIGVGAIVGGGVLALAGVAFATTGPSAIVAFALNSVIALLTALTFAEMSAAFPESGGTYMFAKKVLSVEAAFLVGWVVWFASMVAAVLYALGFAAFASTLVARLWELTLGPAPGWLQGRPVLAVLALVATAGYAFGLARRSGGSGQWATIGKVIVFIVLIAAGLWAAAGLEAGQSAARLRPFFAAGAVGLVQAMGYTFIALQGFDLIAAVGGEVRDPERNLPRAMLGSLAIAVAIYMPLLYVVSTVGVPAGTTIGAMSVANPETVVADAAYNFLGPTGYWLVIVAGVLSMLSALEANLLGASRIAQTMARDRNLPSLLGKADPDSGAPVHAVLVTAAAVALIIIAIPDVAAAGAAASLIFLVSFAMAHWTGILARRRAGDRALPLKLPWFPLIPAVGAAACLALAVFQGFAVTAAGILATVWLGLGGALYFTLFAPRARVADARAEAFDPDLGRLRGHNALTLVPIANPASAGALVELAGTLVTPGVGRVLLLNVLRRPEPGQEAEAQATQEVVGVALRVAAVDRLAAETLITVADDPWIEILRVSRLHRCESLVLGLGPLDGEEVLERVESLVSQVRSDVVLLRAAPGWLPADARRVLVPIGGRRDHSEIRARFLGSLGRATEREFTYLHFVPTDMGAPARRRVETELRSLAGDEAPGASTVVVLPVADVAGEVARRAMEADLTVLGARRLGRHRKTLGELPLRLLRDTSGPLVVISQRG